MATDGLEVHFLDVGQGDSTLFRQGDHAMLIDADRVEDKDTILNYFLNTEGITVPVPGTSYPLGDASFSVFAPVGNYGAV